MRILHKGLDALALFFISGGATLDAFVKMLLDGSLIFVKKTAIDVGFRLEIDIESAHCGLSMFADVSNGGVVKTVLCKKLLCRRNEDVHFLLTDLGLGRVVAFRCKFV